MQKVRFQTPSGFVRRGIWRESTISSSNENYKLDEIQFLPPCEPTKIVCVGLNYGEHADETNSNIPDRPKLFLKPPNTLAPHDSTITLADPEKRFDPEAELAVVIGRQAKNVSSTDALDYIRGFTCFNDLSNRTDQRQEQNWVRGKAFDSAGPIGPGIVPPEEVPEDATIQAEVNGEVRQQSSRDKMIFGIPTLIEEITSYMTLEPGDVIATGTPAGVEPLQHGDTVKVTIENVGTLTNHIQISQQ